MELKPCPFCGGKAYFIATSGVSGYIACIGDCGIHTGTFWDDPMTAPKDEREKWRDIAVRAWNRRVTNEID